MKDADECAPMTILFKICKRARLVKGNISANPDISRP